MKKLILTFLLLLFLPSEVLAQVKINEFSSASNPEWVELYNPSSQQVSLEGWKLVDKAENSLALNGCISAGGFRQFTRNEGWLNNNGDTFFLKNSLNEEIDKVVYGSDGGVAAPTASQSAGRIMDGGSDWQIFESPTPENTLCSLPTPTPTPTLTPTLTPTPTSVPTQTPTPQPTATPAPTNTPAPTLTPAPTVPKPTATPPLDPVVTALEGDVLGDRTEGGDRNSLLTLNEEGAVSRENDEPENLKELYQPPEKKKSLLFPILTIGGGLGFVAFSIWSFLKQEKASSDVI